MAPFAQGVPPPPLPGMRPGPPMPGMQFPRQPFGMYFYLEFYIIIAFCKFLI